MSLPLHFLGNQTEEIIEQKKLERRLTHFQFPPTKNFLAIFHDDRNSQSELLVFFCLFVSELLVLVSEYIYMCFLCLILGTKYMWISVQVKLPLHPHTWNMLQAYGIYWLPRNIVEVGSLVNGSELPFLCLVMKLIDCCVFGLTGVCGSSHMFFRHKSGWGLSDCGVKANPRNLTLLWATHAIMPISERHRAQQDPIRNYRARLVTFFL